MSADLRTPPHSLQAEQGALGCCLLDGRRAGELDPEWFHDLRNRAIAIELLEMTKAAQPITPQTFHERVTSNGQIGECGGVAYFFEALPEATPSSELFSHWRGILQDQAALRRGLEACRRFTNGAHEPQPGETALAVIEELQRDAIALSVCRDGNVIPTKTLVREAIDQFESAVQNQGRIAGLATGFIDLDEMTCGLDQGQLVIVAARPGMGKTSLAMNIAERVAVDDSKPVGVFSLEMGSAELVHRMICCRARVCSRKAKRGELSELDISRMTKASAAISKSPLFIFDRGGMTIGEVSAEARRMHQQHNLSLLVVDFLQLILGGQKRTENRNVEVGLVSTGLKNLARELRIPIIACSQLNRDVEKSDRTPRLSDLRDSGSIEQDADLVGFLHRDPHAVGDACEVTLAIAKHRNGPTGDVRLTFLKRFTRFESTAPTKP